MALATAPDYDSLSHMLMGVELAPSPAEAQGMLCGLLALHLPDALERWHAQLSPEPAADADADFDPPLVVGANVRPTPIDLTGRGRASPPAAHAHDPEHEHEHHLACAHHHGDTDLGADERRAALEQLAAWTEASIEPPSVSVDLLLPPEGRPLYEHASAVLDWVRGLLFGLALGGLGRDQLKGQAGEAFDDLVELTHMDLAAVTDDEADEEALTEIVEFLRVAAMLIREDRAKALVDERDRQAAMTGLH